LADEGGSDQESTYSLVAAAVRFAEGGGRHLPPKRRIATTETLRTAARVLGIWVAHQAVDEEPDAAGKR